jgi:FMN phosphatase YigB (HAD superfamily)
VATAREKILTSPNTLVRPKLADQALDLLADELSAGSISLLTSDVFDTIVFRPVRSPVAIFDLVGEALVARGMLRPQITPTAFGRLRATAERRARVLRHAAYGDHEASLQEIYRQIEPILAEGVALGEAAALEVAVERDMLVPCLDVVATLCYAAGCGVPVVAVSDSYLSGDHIRELFAQPVLEDLVLADVVTSSDRRRNKGGGLLEEVVAELGVPTARLAHIGDHPEADLIVAQRMRARPVHLDRQPPDLVAITEREERFGERRTSGYREQYDGGLAAVRAQLLRSRQLDAVSPALAPYSRWGATVLGPVLTGFAEWVHGRLAELEANRVWCFMREGAFISQMLAAAAPQLEREIDIRTLWLNRAVCGRAALTELTPAALRRVAGTRRTPTIAELLGLIGLRISDLPQLTSHAATALDDPVVHALLLEALAADKPLQARSLSGAARLRERICTLLRRELEGAERLCVVDLGWGGSVPALLQDICAAEDLDVEIRALYLVTNESAAERVLDGVKLEGFLGDLNLPEPALAWFGRSPELIEQACMSENGPLLSLDESLEPVLGEQLIPPTQLAQIRAAQRGALAFQEHWNQYQAAVPGKLGALSAQRALLRAILVRAVVSPTAGEAAALGSWLHDVGDGTSSQLGRLVDDGDMARLRYLAPDELEALPVAEFNWPFALAALADPETAELLGVVHEGRLSSEVLSRPLGTGPFCIVAAEGTGSDGPAARCAVEPRRNRDGLTLIRGFVIANHIQTLELQPSTAPLLVRVDWIEFRLWAQDLADPVIVRMERTDALRRLSFGNCTLVAPNLVIAYTGDATWRLDVREVTDRIVHRAEVECGLVMVPIAPLVDPRDALVTFEAIEQRDRQNEHLGAVLDAVVSSFSWRITRPLRGLKAILRR